MKSRFDALTSAADRRSLAYFRSGAAVGIILSLLALTTLELPAHGQESMPGDSLVLEIGSSQPVGIKALASASLSEQVTDRTSATQRRSTPDDDEFAFGPYYTAEPIGY